MRSGAPMWARGSRVLALLFMAGLGWPLAAPGRIEVELQNRRTWDFPDAGVHFSSQFSGARLNGCEQAGENEFRAVISPENQPINESPWYSFQVWSDRRKSITVRFVYTYAQPRTRPWLSRDGVRWELIEDSDYAVERSSRTAVARLDVGPRRLWVAAQEMIGLKQLGAWMEGKAGLRFARESVIGHSIEGRPIRQLVLSQTTNLNYVFVIGRQHPPEVTGTLGLMRFVDTLAGRSRLAREFRRQFRTVVVPLANPDGVEHGHWRSNLGAVDLNRDWRRFAQPETRAMRDSFLALTREPGARAFALIDFHSTHTNVFYAQPVGRPTYPADLARRWRSAIHERCREVHFRWDDSHNPSSATSGAWGYDQFRAPAITFEYGYDTDRRLIRRASEVAAEELMKLLLEEVP